MSPDHHQSDSIQAGGHVDIVQIDPHDQTKLLKRASPREISFYETFADRLDSTQAPPIWSGWRPDFYGRRVADLTNSAETAETFIILENLVPISNAPFSATGYTHPNILDIKLGTQLYDMDASEEKVARMTRAAAETTSARFGIRLTGGKVWNNQTRSYESFPKAFGKGLDPEGSDLDGGFSRFFPVAAPTGKHLQSSEKPKHLTISSGGIPADLMRKLLEEVLLPQFNRLSDHVSKFEWRVYGSSLLVVYEGDSDVLTHAFGDGHATNDHLIGTVKMIDFAHAWEGQGPDPGLLTGFKTISRMLQGLVDAISQFEQDS